MNLKEDRIIEMQTPLPQSPAQISLYHKRYVGSTEKDSDANQPLHPEIQHELSSSTLLNKTTKVKSEASSPATQAFWLIIWMTK